MFDKSTQLKKKKKPKAGLSRKEERKQAKLDQWENHDKLVYQEVKERSYDPIYDNFMCENCRTRPAQQMHHIIPRSRGGETSLENVRYWCLICHGEEGHHLKIKI